MNELLDKLVSAIADEVRKKLPEIKQEELERNIVMLLQEADWFDEKVRNAIKDEVSLDDLTEEAGKLAADRFHNSFSLSDYETDIKRMTEDVLADYDFRDIVENVVNDHDFTDEIEQATEDSMVRVERRLDKLEQTVTGGKQDIETRKSIERFDRILQAIVSAVNGSEVR